MLEELKGARTAMTTKEIARLLHISEREIYKLAALNRIPHFKIGCSIRFDPPAVATWLEARMLATPERRPPSAVSNANRLLTRAPKVSRAA